MTISPARRSLETIQQVIRAGSMALLLLPVAGAAPALGQGASPGPTPYDFPQAPHDARDLEALFPDSVDGRPLGKLSLGRPSLEGVPDGSLGDLDALAAALGAGYADFEIAFANDPTALATGGAVFNYMAVRVAEVSGSTLVATYEEMTPLTEIDAVVSHTTIDGREVVRIAMPYNPIPTIWFWAEGDVLVGIQTADDATFERLYRLMPGRLPGPSPVASPAA